MRALCEIALLPIAPLRHGSLSACFASQHRDVALAHLCEKAVDNLRSCFSLRKCSSDAEHLHLRTLHGQCERECVVHIVANIRVNDDLLRLSKNEDG